MLKRYHRACYFGCSKEASTSVQVLLNGMSPVMVLTLITLKWQALCQVPRA